jgi:GrpB-like predicted nucleotidyltransferase (UPF0157 family)
MGFRPDEDEEAVAFLEPWRADMIAPAQPRTTALLLIVREPLGADQKDAYTAIEDEISRDCVELGCEHTHAALEPLEGPFEVWWLNAFASDQDLQRVGQAFAENRPLMAALERSRDRKRAAFGAMIETLTRLRPDLSRPDAWTMAGARFVVVTVTAGAVAADAWVFDAASGERYVLKPAATRAEAEAAARTLEGARVLAVQPQWGLPAREWIEADPEFWRPNPLLARIELVPYDPSWPAAFEAEATRLREALGALALRIDHHGSTAVPGLAAKPIIDIQVTVADLQPLAAYAGPLARVGYVHVAHPDDARCPFFHRPAGWPHTHHVHVVAAGGDEERRTLLFRDYLRAHDVEARAYERLKRDLASLMIGAGPETREAYARAKTEFVQRIVRLALPAKMRAEA